MICHQYKRPRQLAATSSERRRAAMAIARLPGQRVTRDLPRDRLGILARVDALSSSRRAGRFRSHAFGRRTTSAGRSRPGCRRHLTRPVVVSRDRCRRLPGLCGAPRFPRGRGREVCIPVFTRADHRLRDVERGTDIGSGQNPLYPGTAHKVRSVLGLV